MRIKLNLQPLKSHSARVIETVPDEGLTLAQAFHKFMNDYELARKAKDHKDIADNSLVFLTKKLYKFLKDKDLDPEAMLGIGARFELADPATSIEHQIKKEGLARTKVELRHPVIKVRGVVIDLIHRRLGRGFTDTYTWKEFQQRWHAIQEIHHLIDLTPAAAVKLFNLASEEAANPTYNDMVIAPISEGYLDYDIPLPAVSSGQKKRKRILLRHQRT